MTPSQKKRTLFVGALIALACIILAPTIIAGLGDYAPSFLSGDEPLPSWWPSERIKLGLDLKGGSYLVLQVRTAEAVKSQLSAIAQAVKSELREKKAGVVRARQVGDVGLEVTLLRDEGEAMLDEFLGEEYRFLQKTDSRRDGRRLVVTYEMGKEKAEEIEKASVDQAIETIRNRVDAYGVAEPTIQRAGEASIMVQLPDVKNIERVKKTIGSVAKLEFRLVADVKNRDVPTREVKRRDGGVDILEDEVLMTGDAIEKANVEVNPGTNEFEVTLRLNSIGKQTFGRITTANVGRNLAIILDGVVQSSPNIREPITGGSAQITGNFSPEEARALAIVLRSGALPAPLDIAEERTVGPSLGADSIKKGIVSMVIGACVVFVFNALYYRKAGVLAVGGLVLTITFLLALLALLGGTLTLPGIAGLILTIGMADDANVIIYERIREELRAGSTGRAAVEAGFAKAHWTILDANITTFITALVLYGFGTGPIKGFAVTLSLGILTSVFCALYVCRLGFEVLNMTDRHGNLSI